MLLALEQAARRIEASLADGDRYRIDGPSTYSAAARTIGGSFRVSRHTYGIAFDVNSRQNPFRGDNKLITNMPEWWVQDFLDAGFCWGGFWTGSKDAMHFAWQGPAFSDATFLPAPYEPLTDEAMFRDAISSIRVIPRAGRNTLATVLADSDSNGAIDVIRIKKIGSDLLTGSSPSSERPSSSQSSSTVKNCCARRVYRWCTRVSSP